jgi:hypothetical protein
MQTAHFARFASLPTRIGGIALGLMVAAGSFAIAGSTRGSGAIDDTDPRTGHAADAARSGEAGAWDLQESAPAAPAAIKPRQWPRCPECGVVESVRRTQVSVGADGQAIALDGSAAFAHGSASESAFDANDGAEGVYEVSVRHRDGSTTMFTTATPRIWRQGSQVNVIGGSDRSSP